MFSKVFWKDAIERAVSTIAQFLLVMGGANGAGFLTVSIKQLIVLSLVGGVASILKSVVAVSTTSGDSASFVVSNVQEKK